MIVDASAVIAVLNGEDDWHRYDQMLRTTSRVQMSAASYVEVGIVVDRRGDPKTSRMLDRLLKGWRAEITSLAPEQAMMARAAHRDFGRGSGHSGRLNLGGCFSYALAAATGQPLLFKGNDFAETDITPALARPSGEQPRNRGTD
jgi:ribonuclease VapC